MGAIGLGGELADLNICAAKCEQHPSLAWTGRSRSAPSGWVTATAGAALQPAGSTLSPMPPCRLL